MKKSILNVAIAGVFAMGLTMLVSCGDSNKPEHNEVHEHHHAEGEGHEHTGGGKHHENTAVFEGEKVTDLSLILDGYLQLKNALVEDNAENAAQASIKLLSAFNGFDMAVVPSDKLDEFMEIVEDAVENAEHISENANNIGHQREHLVPLSEDMNDLIEIIGTNQKLYLAHCPMADAGKGATWVSEVKEIQNPYMGAKMPKCGKVQKEW